MKTLKTTFVLFIFSALAASAQSVLFIGNSFTYRPDKVYSGTVTDLNGKDTGGIPAIFRKIAEEGGHDPQVSLETAGGQTLEWHFKTKGNKFKQPWDIVIMQEYSTRPLRGDGNGKGNNRPAFEQAIGDIKDIVVEQNSDVKIYLYETWARPNLVIKGQFENLDAMQEQLREGYSQAAEKHEIDWVPVGDAYIESVKRGISDNPSTKEVEGPVDVWGNDKYHQSRTGAYLSALVFYTTIYDADPRKLPTDEGSAAAELKISPENAKALQQLAYDIVEAHKS